MQKTLGILGGMGPIATANFYRQLTDKTPVECQEDHIHVIINSNPKIPSRWKHVLFKGPSPVPEIVSSIKTLEEAGCDFVALPCNNVHYFYEEVSRQINIPWLNMLEVVSEHIQHYKKVLVLGSYVTTIKKTYDLYTDNAEYMDTDESAQFNHDYLMSIIDAVKASKDCEKQVNCLLENISEQHPSIEAIVLACTELSIAFDGARRDRRGLDVIDSVEIYTDHILKKILPD
jgi:aspartate racemase